MMRRRVGLVLAIAGALVAGWTPALWGAGGIFSPPVSIPLQIDPQDAQQSELPSPLDNTIVRAGHRGAVLSCTPGPQAYLEKSEPDGTQVWLLTANASQDCDGDGEGDGAGQPLFAGMTSLDPAYIKASSIFDTVVGSNGEIYVTGQILVAWESAGPIGAVSTWGAFILRFAATRELLSDAYFGVEPDGPAAAIDNCAALCATLTGSLLDQYAGRALALGDDLLVTGWQRRADAVGTGDKDLFLARLSTDLAMVRWHKIRPYAGNDEGLDVLVDHQGHALVTGSFGIWYDIFVARFASASGELLNVYMAGGPWHDEGNELSIDASGNVEVSGCFTESATFGPQTTLTGAGPTAFTAQLSPDLLLTAAVAGGQCDEEAAAALASPASGDKIIMIQPGDPRHQQLENQQLEPVAIEFHSGVPWSCADEEGTVEEVVCLDQVADSDNDRLLLRTEVQGLEEIIDVEFVFDLDPQAPGLSSIGIELTSDYCTTITVAVGGGLAEEEGDYFSVGVTELCPLDEPIVTLPVPPQIAETLGFSPSAGGLPAAPLKVRVTMALVGDPCEGCVSGGKDSELDQITLTADFP